MLLLVLVGFGATGIVSGLHFRAEEVEYHRDRLLRKEQAISVVFHFFRTEVQAADNPGRAKAH